MIDPIILGVDPGTCVTGYGILAAAMQVVDYGCIRPPAKKPLAERYHIIFESISQLIVRYDVQIVVVEKQYLPRHRGNFETVLKLGGAKGVIMAAAARYGISVVEYTPSEAKKATVGHGQASKWQVQQMVKSLLNLAEAPPSDAADALALAIGYSNSLKHRVGCR